MGVPLAGREREVILMSDMNESGVSAVGATADYSGVAGRLPLAELAERIESPTVTRTMLSAFMACAGREGAHLDGLSGPLTRFLASQGILGTSGGLTSRGVALRAILRDRAMDRAFNLGSRAL